jgi:ferrous iron transport protein B
MGAIRQEMRDKKWTWAAIGYMCVFAYTVCLIVNQLGLFLKGGGFTAATAVAIVLLAGLVYLIARPNPYLKKSCELE